tara:strand:+ start:4753 stop:5844 length:1092 start_codon:yes stop_codon:yes gene_type:complete
VKQQFCIDNTSLNYDHEIAHQFSVHSSPRNYEVVLSEKTFLSNFSEYCNPGDVILIDKNVLALYPLDSIDIEKYIIDPLEENKNIETVLSFIAFLNEKKFNKANKVLAIGGGITQDIAAFAAAIFKRGVDWYLFPTTLLSMCDSCIGGKTGINYLNVKNQLALFSAPTKVIIHFDFLKTLSEGDLKSGLGEILKLFAMADEELIQFYSNRVLSGKVTNETFYPELIKRALAIKKAVVERDEFELDIRKSLNYGHTVGHAIEVLSDYKISHGQAVVVGMLTVNGLFGFYNKLYDEKCRDLIDTTTLSNLNLNTIDELIKKDKKTLGDKTTFVVLNNFGDTRFVPVRLDAAMIGCIKQAIREIYE